MTITLELTPDLEEQLQLAARRQGKDVAAFLLETVRRQLRRDVLPKADADLLKTINAPIAPKARKERDALLAVQEQRPLTNAEQARLATLIDRVELANAKRWQSLAELAEQPLNPEP